METLLVSAATVAVAEIGDKTQLLAVVLAARYRKHVPIVLGIFVATLLNHTIAASVGYLLGQWLDGQLFRLLVGAGFILMALWALVPDKEDEAAGAVTGAGVFTTTLVAFFLVEIGDKTQVATSLLAARYLNVPLVALGTTLGMMVANVPAVIFGEAITRVVPLKLVRIAAAGAFAVVGAWVIVGALGGG